MSNELNEKDIPVYKKKWFWVVIGVILLVWGLNWYLVGKHFTPQEGGTFGDRFGATTSLFSGLTILGLIITIVLQQNQISLQRQEIESQKTESQEQKEHMMKEKEIAIFFELMNLQNKVLENLQGNSDKTGRQLLNLIRR